MHKFKRALSLFLSLQGYRDIANFGDEPYSRDSAKFKFILMIFWPVSSSKQVNIHDSMQ